MLESGLPRSWCASMEWGRQRRSQMSWDRLVRGAGMHGKCAVDAGEAEAVRSGNWRGLAVSSSFYDQSHRHLKAFHMHVHCSI